MNADTANSNKINREYELLALFEQNSEKIKGQLTAGSSDACDDAEIEGTVNGETVSWGIEYTDSCCPGGKMKFEGSILSSGAIEGKMEPIGLAPGTCRLWWADVEMIKR